MLDRLQQRTTMNTSTSLKEFQHVYYFNLYLVSHEQERTIAAIYILLTPKFLALNLVLV